MRILDEIKEEFGSFAEARQAARAFLPFFIVNEDKRFKDEFAKFLQSRFGD